MPFSVLSKKSLSGVDFDTQNLPDHLEPGGGDIQAQQSAEKGYAQVKGSYRAEIRALIIDYFKESDDDERKLPAELRKEFRRISLKFFEKAFVYGLRASAATASTPRTFDLDQNQLLYVNQAANEEAGYFDSFVKDLRKWRKDPYSNLGWTTRADDYTNTLDCIYNAGKLAAAPSLTIVYWEVHNDDRTCESCVYLGSISPFTSDNVPTLPRSGSCKCLSRCRCDLKYVRVSKKKYAEVQAKQHARDTVLRHLYMIKSRIMGPSGATRKR